MEEAKFNKLNNVGIISKKKSKDVEIKEIISETVKATTLKNAYDKLGLLGDKISLKIL